METIFNKKIIYSLACFVACLILFLYLNRGSDNQPFLKKDASIPAAQSNWPPPLLERNSDIVTETKPKTRKTEAIANAYYESKDYRAFAEMAKKRPEEGGISYALAVTQLCSAIRTVSDVKVDKQKDSVAYGKSIAALNDLRYRCQGFTNKELSDEEINNLAKLMKDKKDIIWVAHESLVANFPNPNDVLKFISDEKRIERLNQMVELQDPESIDGQGLNLTLFKNNEGRIGYWIDGEPYFTESKMSVVTDAWFWASCSIGSECSSKNVFLEYICATDGKCFDNLADYFKQGSYANNPQGYADLVSVKDKIVNAIQNKDFKTFFPK